MAKSFSDLVDEADLTAMPRGSQVRKARKEALVVLQKQFGEHFDSLRLIAQELGVLEEVKPGLREHICMRVIGGGPSSVRDILISRVVEGVADALDSENVDQLTTRLAKDCIVSALEFAGTMKLPLFVDESFTQYFAGIKS